MLQVSSLDQGTMEVDPDTNEMPKPLDLGNLSQPVGHPTYSWDEFQNTV